MADKMFKLQMEMRRNQEEIRDFLTDLDSWSSEIKEEDKKLRTMKPREQAKSSQPPLRSAAVVEKVKKQRQEKVGLKPERIKSADYRKWEKLDVDALCKDIDEEEKDMEEEVQLEIDKLDEERRRKVASEMKEKGNEHFKNSGYEAAIQCYTTGMQADPASPIFPANRAMAYLKLKRYSETEADCTLALSLDPTYTKAYLRRGTARNALGKAASARKDFLDALKLEPGNSQARMELKKLDEDGKKPVTSTTSKALTPNVKNSKYVQPIYKPPKLRSKRPLMRIEVQEIGFEEDPRTEAPALDIDEILGRSVRKETVSQVPKQESPAQAPRISVISESQSSLIDGAASMPSKEAERQSTKEVFAGVDQLTNCKSAPLTNGCSDATTEVGNGESKKVSIPPPPTTSFQFQSDVKKLHNSPFKLYQYLRQIGPSRIPTLLKQQLETETLLPILRCFKDLRDDVILEYLTEFTKVRRFEMAIMFMTNQEKQGVGELFKSLNEHYPSRTEDIRALQRKYGL